MPLDSASIHTLTLKTRPYKVTDARGLYLLILPNGARYWRLKYRFEGKEKSISPGVFPVVGLEEARVQREEARALLKSGIDPSAARKAVKPTAPATSRRPAFRLSLTVDGCLIITTSHQRLKLTPDQTLALKAFLPVTPQDLEQPC